MKQSAEELPRLSQADMPEPFEAPERKVENYNELPQGFRNAEQEWIGLLGQLSEETRLSDFLAYESLQYGYSILRDPEVRERLIEDCKNMCHKLRESHTTDVVFLDRSARPLAYMMRKMWPLEVGEVDMPLPHFINIGREKIVDVQATSDNTNWLDAVTGNFMMKYKTDVTKISTMDPEELRRAIAPDAPDYYEKIRNIFTLKGQNDSVFKQKNVMIVDDIKGSGVTLNLAEKIFSTVFGDEITSLDTYYFERRSHDGTGMEGMPWSSVGSAYNYDRDDRITNNRFRRIPTEGMVGVVEPESTDAILAESISAEWVQHAEQVFRDSYQDLLDEKYRSSFEQDVAHIDKFLATTLTLFEACDQGLSARIRNIFEERKQAIGLVLAPNASFEEINNALHILEADYSEHNALFHTARKAWELQDQKKGEEATLELFDILANADAKGFAHDIEHEYLAVLDARAARGNAALLRTELTKLVLYTYFCHVRYDANHHRTGYMPIPGGLKGFVQARNISFEDLDIEDLPK